MLIQFYCFCGFQREAGIWVKRKQENRRLFAFKGAGELELEREYDLEKEGKRKGRELMETGKGRRRQGTRNASAWTAGEAEGSWVTVAAFQTPRWLGAQPGSFSSPKSQSAAHHCCRETIKGI